MGKTTKTDKAFTFHCSKIKSSALRPPYVSSAIKDSYLPVCNLLDNVHRVAHAQLSVQCWHQLGARGNCCVGGRSFR